MRRRVVPTLVTSLAVAVAVLAGPLGAPVASAAPGTGSGEWQDGRSDQDTIWNCWTNTFSTGTSANVGWRSTDGQVPEVGEKFYLRGYIGLVSVPCTSSGTVAVVPEILVPPGVEFVDEDVVWDLTRDGQAPDLDARPLGISANGAHGGVLLGTAQGEPFSLRRGDVLEFRFPVRATRELKGPATQRPECQSRVDGDAPCPVSQAGDHLQVGFTVTGHGGDKSYVTPYVGLFAAPTTPPPAPVKVGSRTSATFAVSTARRGSARVVVSASRVPTGTVAVYADGRRVAARTLTAAMKGRATVSVPRLRRGTHRLVVRYLGSASVKPSTSAVRVVRLR